MIQIIPAILANTQKEFKEQLGKIEKSGEFEWVHLDVMDGQFVNNRTYDPAENELAINLKIEAHLMVNNPDSWADTQISEHYHPNNNTKRIIFHLEAGEFSKNPKSMDWLFKKAAHPEVGIAISPKTKLKELEPFLDRVNAVLIMSVEPGYGGQEFIAESLQKIREAARLREENGLDYLIGVDGGINDKTIKQVIDAGADYAVVGSYLLKGDIEENLEKLWEVMNAA